ncbi:MAG: LysM peptidoglycan-binding domain-containing protein [Chloroflexi bacterium]|nr:LysM peptidoglycan-binding domain-containing protein [Chloroflexota bacterium]
MKKILLQYFLIGMTLLVTFLMAEVIQAQGDSATTVINTINQLRGSRGLAALQSHPALMSSALGHSQYQASIGTWTHVSADGSRPIDRAYAAGFGNGVAYANIYISENVAYGLNMSIMETINGPWNDPDHHHTMYNPSAKYIGAGVAYAGDYVYYTVDTGYWVGDPAPTPEYPSVSSTPSSSLIPTAVPVVVSTPMSDGTIKHIIAGGQTLWTIAAVYNITLEELRELNDLEPDAIMNLGDEVLIEPSYTPTNTPIGEPSATLPARFTHTPSPAGSKGTPVQFSLSTPSPTGERASEPRFQTSAKNPTIVILAVIISGSTLIAALMFSLRKK